MEVLPNQSVTAPPNSNTYTIGTCTVYPYNPEITIPSGWTYTPSVYYVPTERHEKAFRVAKMLVETKRVNATSAKAFIELIEELVKVL